MIFNYFKVTFVLVTITLLSLFTISAQTVIFNADFDSNDPDNNWFNDDTNFKGNWVLGGGGDRYVRPNRWFNYRNGLRMSLISPTIDFSLYQNLTLDLNYFYNTEAGNDGMNIQYSIDNGPWLVLGDVASGYYNDTDVDGIGNEQDGWSGNNAGSNVFTAAPTLDMSAFDPNLNGASNVRFKVVFGTNNNVTDAGVAWDDFIIRGTIAAGPEIEVLGNGLEIVDNDTTPDLNDDTDFGAVQASLGSETHTFTIYNSGNQALDLTGSPSLITITGIDAAQYSVTLQPDANIASGASSTFEITYTPTAVGVHTAQVSIDNTDATENPYNFTIMGQGIGPNPEINIISNGNSITSGDTTPSSLDGTFYGVITEGITSTKSYQIFNQGNEILDLTGSPFVIITGANADQFAVTEDPLTPISPGGNTIFNITYTPTVAGVHNATVSIANNDTDENPYTFAIQGESLGQRPEVEVSGSNIPISNNDTTPNSFDGTDFGNAVTGTTDTHSFRISNTGLATLNLTGVAPNYVQITGPNADQFSINLQPNNSIASSGGSTVFEISYSPTVAGLHEASIFFENDDDDEGFYLFDIKGAAVLTAQPEIEVSGAIGVPIFVGDTTPSVDDNTDYGTVFLGDTKVVTHGIRNLGTDVLTIGSFPYVSITGPDAAQFQLVSVPQTGVIPPSDVYVPYEIRYNPTTSGTHNATVSIENNDADEGPVFTYAIRGNSGPNPDATFTIYYESFNETDGGWTVNSPGAGSQWIYGENPAEFGADGNHWYTSEYGSYLNNTNTYLTSPLLDLSGFSTLEFNMDVRYNTDNDIDSDGMNVEYSTDNGSTWSLLGDFDVAGIGNWYNIESIGALGSSGWSGLTVGSADDPDKSQFNEVKIKLPALLDNQSQVRLRIRFATNNQDSDAGVNVDNIFVKGNPLTPFAPAPLGPGDVKTNLTLWLKGNNNSGLSDGDPVSLWEDLGQNNDAIGIGVARPIYHDSQAENINHNPVVSFSSAGRSRMSGKGGYSTKDYWLVVKSQVPINQTEDPDYVISGRISDSGFSEDGTGFVLRPASIRFNGVDNLASHLIGATPQSLTDGENNSYGRAYESSTDSFVDEVILFYVTSNDNTGETEIYKNGRRIDNYTGRTSASNEELQFVELINSQYNLGTGFFSLNGHPFQTYFDGKIAEVASYSSPNSLVGFLKLQSYFALKYGISLTAIENPTYNRRVADQYYIDTSTRIVWHPIQNESYLYDVAAIGRDDLSGLEQNQSTSSNTGSLLTIGLSDIYSTNTESLNSNPDRLDNYDFLIWGNDGAPLAADTPIFVDLSNGISGLNTLVNFTSIERSWKVIEHGDVGKVKVSLPEIALSATITPPGDYLMFISDTPSFSPTSEYRVLTANGSNLETEYDFDGTKYITFGFAPEYIYERSISFDGAQDYMDADDVIDLEPDFTISAWIKRDASSNDTDILSKRDAAPFTQGYSLRIAPTGHAEFMWTDGGTERRITSSTVIPIDEWHQIAFINDGGQGSIYIDGVVDGTAPITSPAINDEHFLIAAANHRSPSNLFSGNIDEIRVWKTALSIDQLHYAMNQEIQQFTDSSVNGNSIPKTISKNELAILPWNRLEAYFQMNKYTYTNIKDDSDNGHIAAIKNLDTVDEQTAPLPYQSATGGDWTDISTWENGSIVGTPGAASIVDGTPITWNIAETDQSLYIDQTISLLGLNIKSGDLEVRNDNLLEISHYLKLNGKLDLQGESQLVQTQNSDLDVLSTGFLERDQQGTADVYTYNFWSSPVGGASTTSINQGHTLQNIMHDGSTPASPVSMNFTAGLNGSPTTPITLSTYWMFKFANTAGGNNDWQYLGHTGNLDVGLGVTMKGPGTAAINGGIQNYTFIGKPNNSTDAISIEHFIAAGNNTLVGNPFPSALDAHDFIDDNTHLTGTLYFWEHWGGGDHILANYQGGYAMRNKMDGVPAASHPNVSQVGVGTKIAKRYIPVGQGFFVVAASDGNIRFDNSQRDFELETGESTHFFWEPQDTNETANSFNGEEDDFNADVASLSDGEDLRPKIRIGFQSPQQYHRQILLGVDSTTTYGLDRAYDAVALSENEEDMSWILGEDLLAIQSIPELDEDHSYPLRVVTAIQGDVQIGIDFIENINLNDIEIYVHDIIEDTHTLINESIFSIELPAGVYEGRFEIVFRNIANDDEEEETEEEDDSEEEGTGEEDETLSTSDNTDDLESELSVNYNSSADEIVIKNIVPGSISEVHLISMLGQTVQTWSNLEVGNEMNLQLESCSAAPYIVQIVMNEKTISRKIIKN